VPLAIEITSTPRKYLEHLDKPTRERIHAKLREIAADPLSARHSKPLIGSHKRTARVGGYRILFEIDTTTLTVSDIGPRGQIYRKL
jgi:mRNA-degrading endonuclease RelE of RelBE toxin-antitoxin system